MTELKAEKIFNQRIKASPKGNRCLCCGKPVEFMSFQVWAFGGILHMECFPKDGQFSFPFKENR